MKEHYDVIIVGTGAAGLYCALSFPERIKVLMITKKEADQSDSFWRRAESVCSEERTITKTILKIPCAPATMRTIKERWI